jgi:hypothetical protein
MPVSGKDGTATVNQSEDWLAREAWGMNGRRSSVSIDGLAQHIFCQTVHFI